MAQTSPVLAVTSGEPAGIGPDLCLQLAQHAQEQVLVVLADKALLQQRATQLGLTVKLVDYRGGGPAQPLPDGSLYVLHQSLVQPVQAGELNSTNSQYVLNLLSRAVAGCRSGEFDGMVTAPVHKGVINDAGIPFTGHTEFLAEQTGTAQVVMMLVGGGVCGRHGDAQHSVREPARRTTDAELSDTTKTGNVMRVALATTHLSLREVPDAITVNLLESVLRILQRDLELRFDIAQPRILVAGLNPHAGEGGHLGREEVEIMIPALDRLRAEGMDISGPLPADTMFTPQRLAQCDCVLAMYHDQGLPVLKHASFGQGVNVTLGLPIIRTSVDHGTALELAGTGRADVGSMLEAICMATDMVRCEHRHDA